MVNHLRPSEAIISSAIKAADNALFLQSTSDISRASKAWRKCKYLGLDTEFVRERTYYAELGLVQISDGQTVWLVDPLVKGSQEPIRELLENTEITKIFHSPSEDLDVLNNTVGALPQPIIDTQMACALLGQPLQLAYHATVRWLLDIELDNDQTRSNWVARPLSSAQLRYAALDVCLLPMMWEMLEHQLNELGRLSWLLDDCQQVISSAQDSSNAAPAWMRIRGIGKLDGESLAILEALYLWREHQARTRNLPRGFIVKDPVLLNIARQRPADLTELGKTEELHPGAFRRYGESLLEMIHAVQDAGHTLPTIQPFSRPERDCLAQMKSAVADKAKSLEVEAAVIASRRELEGLLRLERHQWPAKINGWRTDLVGAEIEDICAAGRQ